MSVPGSASSFTLNFQSLLRALVSSKQPQKLLQAGADAARRRGADSYALAKASFGLAIAKQGEKRTSDVDVVANSSMGAVPPVSACST